MLHGGDFGTVRQVEPSRDSQVGNRAEQIRVAAFVAVETHAGVHAPVGVDLLVVGEHQVVVHLTPAAGLLRNETGKFVKIVGRIGSSGKELAQIWLTHIVLTGIGVHTEAIRQVEVLQEIVTHFKVTIEALRRVIVCTLDSRTFVCPSAGEGVVIIFILVISRRDF